MFGESFDGLWHVFVVVSLSDTNRNHRFELVVLAQKVTLKLHGRDHEPIALGDVHGQLHLAFVGRDGHLGGINAELQKASGQIIGSQGFQIGVELGAWIAVGFGVPTQPAAGVQVEQVAKGPLGKRLCTHDANGFNFGHITLDHTEVQVHTVSLCRGHRGDHLGGVHAAVEVLALELLFSTIGQRFVKRTAFGQANVSQSFLQNIGFKLFDARKSDIGHTRTLLQGDDQHLTFDL